MQTYNHPKLTLDASTKAQAIHRLDSMFPPESIYPTTANHEYSNYTKIVEILKEEMNKTLKQI